MMIEREVVFLVCAYICEREYLYVTRSCVCVSFDDRLNKNTKRREKRREYLKGGVRTKHLRVRDRLLRS